MRFDNRLSRHYNLKKNEGDYDSSDSLCGWWSFFESDQGKDTVQAQTNSANVVSGALKYSSAEPPARITNTSLETPAFLKGDSFLRNAGLSITTTPTSTISTGFEVSNFPAGAQASNGLFTFSITFKLLQHWTQQGDDDLIVIAEFSDTTNTGGRYALIYDQDGGAAGVPAVSIQALNDVAASSQWNAHQSNLNPSWSKRQQCRDWIHLVVVVDDPTLTNLQSNSAWANNTGAAIYINGNRIPTDVPGSALPNCTQALISKILIGGFNSTFATNNPGIRNAIQLGEFALWNSALSEHEISWLYARATTSYNSGILTNPQGYCGDCEHDSYPTIKRTGDYHRKGTATPVFDDTGHYTPPRFGETINYPTLLLTGAEANSAVGSLIATPHTLPTIYVQQAGTAGTETDVGQSNVVRNYKRCADTTDSSDKYVPFNDSSVPSDIATLSSHLSDLTPGFSRDLSNRIIIDIDITPSTPHVMRVLTGSLAKGGDTFGASVGDDLPEEDTTGLSYFNFTTMKYEPMGGRNSETGTRTRWNLPEEISSSFTLDTLGSTGMTVYSDGRINLKQQSCHSYAPFSTVPRIFQPYSSLIAHRSTFNHVFGSLFNTWEFPQGRSVSGDLDFLTRPVNGSTAFSKFRLADLPATINFPNPTNQQARGFGGQANYEAEFLPFADDISGYRWDGTNVLKASMMWDAKSGEIARFGSGSKHLGREFARTFGTMGRPVAYSGWTNNSVFHASSSQTLKMSDYINDPFLLESFEVISEVTAHRYTNPMTKTVSTVGVANDTTVMYANTNNHIDCLTYFLLRQENRHSKAFDKDKKSKESTRDLIGFSNNVFSSCFVGWDMNDSSKNEVDVAYFSTVPYNGARVSRVFKVYESDITENVPAVGEFAYYLKDNGVQPTSHGYDGIFFSNKSIVMDTGNVSDLADLSEDRQPPHRWMTASIRTGGPKPVRVCTAYAQHSHPILPMIAGEWRDPSLFHPNQPNRYFGTSGLNSGNGWNAGRGLWKTQGSWGDKTTPRKMLACMGTYWPGGVSFDPNRNRIPKLKGLVSSSFSLDPNRFDTFTLPQSILGPTGSVGAPEKYDFRQYSEMVPNVFAGASLPSPRTILVGDQLVNRESGKIGGAAAEIAKDQPGLNTGFTPTNAIAFWNTQYNQNFSQHKASFGPPYYIDYDLTGSSTQESAYVLLPEDEIIFGAQWSPADAAHRSFKEIEIASNVLSFTDQDPSNVGTTPGYPVHPASHRTGSYSVSPFIDPAGAPVGSPVCRGNIKASEVGQHAYRYIGFTETNDLVLNASASCTIKANRSVLRLYGTLIKDQKQKHHSLPQQLTTLCVHEVVGNEPVLDQYDVASQRLMSTSAAAKNISGSMNTSSRYDVASMPETDTSFGLQSRILNLGRGVRRSFEFGNLHDVGSVKRVVNYSDVSEYYYDSLAPSIPDMWAVDGVGTISSFSGFGLKSQFGVGGSTFTQARRDVFAIAMPTLGAPSAFTGTNSPNSKFARSFPFEPRYKNCTRQFGQPAIKTAYHFTSMTRLLMYSASLYPGTTARSGYAYANPDTPALTSPGLQHFDGSEGFLEISVETVQQEERKSEVGDLVGGGLQRDGTAATYTALVRKSLHHRPSPSLTYQDVNYVNSKFQLSGSSLVGAFGVGDNRDGTLDAYYYYQENDGPAPGLVGNVLTARLLARKPRGFRYGLINAEPKNYSAVYRRDSYGQFRDMLEQRPFSAAFLNDPPFMLQKRTEAGLPPRFAEVDRGPISITFRTPSFLNPTAPLGDVKTNPSNTNSSNLDMFASSSVPFFDGESRNRDGAPPSETIVVS